MGFLNDKEIVTLLAKDPPLVDKIHAPADWYTKVSPVQASSIDLHVGAIFKPGVDKDERGGQNNPENSLSLESGQTVMVTTEETLNLPAHIMAFGFPPARVSSQGLLMTNPGHVDPGYQGTMRFTLINMGRESYPLKRGDPIVTLLIAALDNPPEASYQQRRSGQANSSGPVFDELHRLGPDFLDFKAKASRIAVEAVRDAELSVKHAQTRATYKAAIFSALITAVLGGLIAFAVAQAKPGWEKQAESLQSQVNVLSSKLDVVELNRRISALEARLPPVPAAPARGQTE